VVPYEWGLIGPVETHTVGTRMPATAAMPTPSQPNCGDPADEIQNVRCQHKIQAAVGYNDSSVRAYVPMAYRHTR